MGLKRCLACNGQFHDMSEFIDHFKTLGDDKLTFASYSKYLKNP